MTSKINIPRALDIASAVAQKTCFLFGPRQCGKSWLIRHTLADAHVFDLLSSDTFLRLTRHPEYIEETCTDERPVVIDEIQKAPQLLDEVHRLIESKGMRFLLTGSSARKLRRKGVNLLGGRARIRSMHPLSAFELGPEFDLERAVNCGTLPSMYFSDAADEDLADYIGLYVKEEIAAEGATRNLPAFSRFLEVAALSNAQQINYSQIANDAQVPRSTVQEYFGILKDTLLANEVPVWKKSTTRKTVDTAKFYMFDTGVIRKAQKRGWLTPGTTEFGVAFETLVYNELKTYLDIFSRESTVSYWRTKAGTEVDFIIDDATAIEVKGSSNITGNDLKGLKALMEENVIRNFVVVSREPVPRQVGGISILPFQEFSSRLWAGAYL